MPTLENIDLTSEPFVMTPMSITDTSKNLITSMIANIQQSRGKFSDLAEGTEDKLNEIINTVNALQSGYDVDFVALQEKVEAILYLESEGGDESFVGLFTKLFNAINSRKQADAFVKTITSSPAGKVAVDLSAYGFGSIDEFEVIPSVVTDEDGRSIEATFKKISETEGEITLRDADRLLFADNPESFYEAEVKGEVKVTLMLVYTAKAITGHITEVDGDEVDFGV